MLLKTRLNFWIGILYDSNNEYPTMIKVDLSKEFEYIVSQFEREQTNSKNIFCKQLDERLKYVRDAARKSHDNYICIKLSEQIVLELPLFKRGTVHTSDLISLDDLLAFGMYQRLYLSGKYFVDIGANIGLHSIVAAKIGYYTISFEPDEPTFSELSKNFSINKISSKQVSPTKMPIKLEKIKASLLIKAAVSNFSGEANFIRIADNFFGNHIKGMKNLVYGEHSEHKIQVVSGQILTAYPGVIKIDAEGADSRVLHSLINAEIDMGRNTILLCDWRHETLDSLYELISDGSSMPTLGRSGNEIVLKEQLPINRDADFVVLGRRTLKM
jgi:FkbM family methyltransferase